MAYTPRFVKSIGDLQTEAEHGHGLKRTLGPVNLVALGIGAIIGAGLFSLTGIAAAEHAGPAVTISFVIAAVCCAFAGLCYAEFSSMIPIAGSAYTYSYATMGELLAWIIGWDLVLEYAVGAATVGVSWSGYFVAFLHHWGVDLPTALIASPWQPVLMPDGSMVYGMINLPAVVIVFSLSLLLMKGTEESSFFNNIMVILKIAVVLVFITLGYSFINPTNFETFIPVNTGTFGEFGWSGIFQGAAVVFFAFIGFDAVSTAAQEAKDPQRTMPIGIIGSLLICTVLYVLFSYVMVGVVHYSEFENVAAPVAVVIAKLPYEWLKPAVNLAILAGYSSVILVMLLGQSRVFFSMSKDGLLPKLFSDVHPRFHTPWRSNLLFGVLVSMAAGFAPISALGHMTSIGTLFAFALVCLGIIVLRKAQPNLPRQFKTPLVPLIPILGIVSCLILMYSLGLENWLRLIIWMALGFVVYYGYSIKHSKVRKEALNKA